MTFEKRLTPRIPIHECATVKICGESGSLPCTIENVSRGGVLFSTTRELLSGGHVELHIPSPEDEADIVLHAQILRVLPGKELGTHDYACQLNGAENV